jgi:hypothetical protein
MATILLEALLLFAFLMALGAMRHLSVELWTVETFLLP